MDTALRRAKLDRRDRGFAANLAYSTLRFQGTLDWALGQVLTRPLAQVEEELLDVLRLGAWQVLYGGTPDRAAVDTAVDLARAVVGARATGFTNGVLRGLVRQRDALKWPDEDTAEGLGLALGYPSWIVTEARARFGSGARSMLEAGNVPPGLTLRAVGDSAGIVQELRDAGVEVTEGRWVPEAIHAPGANPSQIPAVAEGRAVPQDEASMLVTGACVADLPAGALVLDACAAPGGKTTHLAQLSMRVVAADLRPGRARMVADAANRLRMRAPVVIADGLAPPWRPQAFDAVLVDAPCTGLGTVRRRPEVRWRRSPEDPDRLGTLQHALLRQVAPLVKRGGKLVYSACTWPLAETVDVARAFLASHGHAFTAEPAKLEGAGTQLDADPGTQLTPDLDGTDAMYVCLFRRT